MGNVDWGLAIGTTLTGLIVVFLVLVFLWFIVGITGGVCSSIAKKAKATEVVAPEIMEPTPQAADLTEEVVAAITSAVGMVMTNGFKLKYIRLQGGSENLWQD